MAVGPFGCAHCTILRTDNIDQACRLADCQSVAAMTKPIAHLLIAFTNKGVTGGYVQYREFTCTQSAIEIVDSRIADWKITFADTVADNGSAAFFVLGNDPRPLAEVDLWTCGMVLEINGEIASLGAGAACLGHPLNAVTWLAQTLAARGEHLRKGDLILSGALAPMMVITPGDKVKVSIGGLGSVSFAYGDDR